MTENDFLLPETRYGIFISAEKKDFLNKQLKILLELGRVCNKYGLKYFAIGGTLLGAVRHSGFIPWDDDIDVIMLRDDYEKLMEIGKDEFKNPFFLQNTFTDKLKRGHAELRDNRFACFMKSDFGAEFNLGMFIDIFALDNVDDENILNIVNEARKKYDSVPEEPSKKGGYSHSALANFYNIFIYPLVNVLFHLTLGPQRKRKKYCDYIEFCKNVSKSESVCAIEYTGSLKSVKPVVYSIKDFDDVVYLDFEYIKIPCPKNYHNVLTDQFGDYMTPAKVNGYHGDLFYDTNKSYKEYAKIIKSKKNFYNLFKNL